MFLHQDGIELCFHSPWWCCSFLCFWSFWVYDLDWISDISFHACARCLVWFLTLWTGHFTLIWYVPYVTVTHKQCIASVVIFANVVVMFTFVIHSVACLASHMFCSYENLNKNMSLIHVNCLSLLVARQYQTEQLFSLISPFFTSYLHSLFLPNSRPHVTST